MITFKDILHESFNHFTTRESAKKILNHGFKVFNKKRNDYGNGIYFTTKTSKGLLKNRVPFNVNEAVFQWDGKGLNLYEYHGIEKFLSQYKKNQKVKELVEKNNNFELRGGWAEVLNKSLLLLGFDGFVSQKDDSYKGLIVVYNVKKLNDLLRQGKIKLGG